MTVTFAEACEKAEDAEHPVLRMLKDADERLNQMEPDITGALVQIRGARLAVALMNTSGGGAKPIGLLAMLADASCVARNTYVADGRGGPDPDEHWARTIVQLIPDLICASPPPVAGPVSGEDLEWLRALLDSRRMDIRIVNSGIASTHNARINRILAAFSPKGSGQNKGDKPSASPAADLARRLRAYAGDWRDRAATCALPLETAAFLERLAAGQSLTGKSEDGSSELMLCTTTCFECGHELHPPFCPACNPEIAALSQESQPDDRHLCASEDPYDRCLKCDCWKLTREMCS